MRFLMALKRLDADYIIMDLGAGTAYNTIDFFLLAERQLMIVIPEPTSIENAYRFLCAKCLAATEPQPQPNLF